MKKRIGIVFFFILASLQILRADCAYTPLFETLYRTPVIVYGKIKNLKQSKDGAQTANLLVEMVLKGNLKPTTIEVLVLDYGYHRANIQENDKKVYFISQTADKKWQIAPGKCTVNQLFVNNKQEIEIAHQRLVSFSDFQEGLTLLAKNYDALHNYSKQDILNPTSNNTFKCLIDQIRGQIAPTHPEPPLPPIEPTKKEKKRKTRKKS